MGQHIIHSKRGRERSEEIITYPQRRQYQGINHCVGSSGVSSILIPAIHSTFWAERALTSLCHNRNPSSETSPPSLPNAKHLSLVVGRSTALASIGLGGLGLSNTLGQNLGVLGLERLSVVFCEESKGQGIHTASSLTFSAWRRLSATRWRLCWRRWGVTRRWILGALV